MRLLRRAEHSRRLLLLRALVDQLVKRPDLAVPLPPPEDAWNLLERAQFAAPGEVDAVLDHPYTGSWLSYTMRLLRSGIAGVAPLWVHIGYLHALSVAAAIRAGINFETAVPVWHGGAIVPTLGLIRLPDRETYAAAAIRGDAGTVEVELDATRILLPRELSTETAEWWPVRQLAVSAAGRALSVHFDDVDPYRGSYEPIVHQRATEPEITSWHRLLPRTWASLVDCLPEFADAMSVGFDVVGPLPVMAHRPSSESNGEAFGSAMIGLPDDPHELAAMLVHEFQHIRLSGLTHITRLCHDDPTERLYAPWRDDPRPIAGFIQGIYAFAGVCAYWRALVARGGGRRARFEFALHRTSTWRAISGVLGDGALTEAGTRFVAAIAAVVRPWLDEPVSRVAERTAWLAATDHHLGWRLRHVRPDRDLVSVLATAWRTGTSPAHVDLGPDRPPIPVPDGDWSRARAELLRLVMTDAPTASWAEVPDATVADAAWVTGRFDDAVRGYRAELAVRPDRPASWAGLATSLAELGPSRAVRMLMDRPELVRAVHRQVRGIAGPEPDKVADWLGAVVG